MSDHTTPDAKPKSVEELLTSLHHKFSSNFDLARPSIILATDVERRARALSIARDYLEKLAADAQHQRELAFCLDEVFGDAICALYLTFCGMNVPARMLLRRSLELGLVVGAYWDSPVNFWNWKTHDSDIRFSELSGHLKSAGYKTMCERQSEIAKVDSKDVLENLDRLYSQLSNVVHPKPYNFATAGINAYSFDPDELRKTLSFALTVLSSISTILSARFAALSPILRESLFTRV